jgi:hypothetical protein
MTLGGVPRRGIYDNMKNVQDSRRRIWQEAGKRRFGSLDELNVWLLERCRQLWRELKHPERGELTPHREAGVRATGPHGDAQPV